MVPRLRFVIMFITIIICTLLPYTIAADSGTPGSSRRRLRGSGSRRPTNPADESQPGTPSWLQLGLSSQQQTFTTDTEFAHQPHFDTPRPRPIRGSGSQSANPADEAQYIDTPRPRPIRGSGSQSANPADEAQPIETSRRRRARVRQDQEEENYVPVFIPAPVLDVLPDELLLPPEDGPQFRTCVRWVQDNHYTRNFERNIDVAQRQGIFFHRDYHYWATGFAYGLAVNFDHTQYTPKTFCARHVPRNARYKEISLRNARFTCRGWINFYGYDHTLNGPQRLTWILSRNYSLDHHISIWATLYFRFVTANSANSQLVEQITSAFFCHALGHFFGKELPLEYPFMTLDGSEMSCANPQDFLELLNDPLREDRNTTLPFVTMDTYISCEDWIKQYGYTNSSRFNTWKAQRLDGTFSNFYDSFIAAPTVQYLIHLRTGYRHQNPTLFCNTRDWPQEKKMNFIGTIL